MCSTTASLLLSRLTPGSVERISAVSEMRSGAAAWAVPARASEAASAALDRMVFMGGFPVVAAFRRRAAAGVRPAGCSA